MISSSASICKTSSIWGSNKTNLRTWRLGASRGLTTKFSMIACDVCWMFRWCRRVHLLASTWITCGMGCWSIGGEWLDRMQRSSGSFRFPVDLSLKRPYFYHCAMPSKDIVLQGISTTSKGSLFNWGRVCQQLNFGHASSYSGTSCLMGCRPLTISEMPSAIISSHNIWSHVKKIE